MVVIGSPAKSSCVKMNWLIAITKKKKIHHDPFNWMFNCFRGKEDEELHMHTHNSDATSASNSLSYEFVTPNSPWLHVNRTARQLKRSMEATSDRLCERANRGRVTSLSSQGVIVLVCSVPNYICFH